MSVLLGTIIPYAIATSVVILFWRYIHGRHPYLLLAVIYLAAFVLWHLLNALLIKWQAGLPGGIEEWLAAAILYMLGIDFLLGNYTCIGRDSPSMTLFTLINDAGGKGCSPEEIVRGFREHGHVEDRVDAMEDGRLVRNDNGSFTATKFGRTIRWCFDTWFRILGQEEVDND